MAKGARDLGAEIRRFTPVEGIRRAGGGEWVLETPHETIICESVVNAGGYRGGEVAALLGQQIPVVTLEHAYLVTEGLAELAGRDERLPLLRDPDDCFYLRQEGAGLLLGSYGEHARVAWPDGIPPDFAMDLFPDVFEDVEPVVEKAVARVPLLGKAGIQRMVNGPIAYAPDAQPLVGPAFGLPNVYHCCALQVGITHGPAAGKTIAELVLEGESEWDTWAWDPRRFGPWATADFAAKRACELYEHQYAIPFPHRQWSSGRPLQTTPLHDRLGAKGAVHGQVGGWERPLWFQTDRLRDDGHLSFHHEAWHAAVRDECLAVRDRVGVMDHGGFTRLEVSGKGAAGFLDRMICGSLPALGRLRLSFFLTAKGFVLSEATVGRLAEDRFQLWGPTLAAHRDYDWLDRHLPVDGSVTLRDVAPGAGALLVMGPQARTLLSRVTAQDLSNHAFPWMSLREIQIGPAPVTALRVSYVGELGWELHMAEDHLAEAYERLQAAGSDLGLVDFGSYALNAMRLEKGYPAWQADFGPEYTPFEAGLERFVRLDKPDFVGRAALLRHQAAGPRYTFAAFRVQSAHIDALPSDPIFQTGRIVGTVTSAGTGFRVGGSLALGTVEPGLERPGQRFEIEILGERYPAETVATPLYDPANSRLRS